MDMRLRIDIGKTAGGGDTVFERKACAGWCLGAVGQNPPVAVRATADLEGAEVQVMAVGGFTDHGARNSGLEAMRAGGT